MVEVGSGAAGGRGEGGGGGRVGTGWRRWLLYSPWGRGNYGREREKRGENPVLVSGGSVFGWEKKEGTREKEERCRRGERRLRLGGPWAREREE